MSNYYVNSTSLTSFFNTQKPQSGPTTGYQQSNGTDIASLFTLYMFGTRSLCKYLSGTTDIGNYYQRDSFTIAPICVTYGSTTYNGVYNMPPWYVTSSQMSTATWIWDRTTAASDAPVNQYLWFYYTFFYSGAANTGRLWAITDDQGTFYLNQGTGIGISGGWPTSGDRGNISIVNGLNYIRVSAYNQGGPAGLLISILDSGNNKIATTNGNWAISGPTANYNTPSQALTYNSTATTESSSSGSSSSGSSSSGSSSSGSSSGPQ